MPSPPTSTPPPDDAYVAESIDDDPLVASSGQVIVSVQSRYHVVYCP